MYIYIYIYMSKKGKDSNEKRVLIIGAGPVGLYTALKFLKGNYFSTKNEKTKKLRIEVVERRDEIKCFNNNEGTWAGIMSASPLNGNYQQLINENQALNWFHSLKETMKSNDCKVDKKYWASRQQVFYITRENLKIFDPIVRKLLRAVSCGSSTTPGKWGFLKCIIDSSKSNYSGSTEIDMGDEYPSLEFKDKTDYTRNGWNPNNLKQLKADYAYFNRMPKKYLPSAPSQGGSLTIEAGMLQIILMYSIKLEVLRQKQTACANTYTYNDDPPDYEKELEPGFRHTAQTACKVFKIRFNWQGKDEEIMEIVNSGKWDMVFNSSGRGLPKRDNEVSSVCHWENDATNQPNNADVLFLNENLPRFDKNKNGNNFERTQYGAHGKGVCKQWGSIMEVQFGHENNTSDIMFTELMDLMGFSQNDIDKLGESGVEDYYLRTFKGASQYFATPVLPAYVGDYDRSTHDLRIFPSRGEGLNSKTGRLYMGVLLSGKENQALCAVYGTKCKGGSSGSKVKLSFTRDAEDNTYGLVINGIIVKYAILAHSRGVPWNTVDWVGCDFSWFPMTLTKVKKGTAAKKIGKTTFVNIGDAAYSAHYFSGMGVNNGLTTVNFIFDRLKNKSTNNQFTPHIGGGFVKGYNTYIEDKAVKYREEIRYEFGPGANIVPGLYGIQNTSVVKKKDLVNFMSGMHLVPLPQEKPQSLDYPAVEEKFWRDPKETRQFSQNNPQVKQYNVRKEVLGIAKKKDLHKDWTLFEIYLYYLQNKTNLRNAIAGDILSIATEQHYQQLDTFTAGPLGTGKSKKPKSKAEKKKTAEQRQIEIIDAHRKQIDLHKFDYQIVQPDYVRPTYWERPTFEEIVEERKRGRKKTKQQREKEERDRDEREKEKQEWKDRHPKWSFDKWKNTKPAYREILLRRDPLHFWSEEAKEEAETLKSKEEWDKAQAEAEKLEREKTAREKEENRIANDLKKKEDEIIMKGKEAKKQQQIIDDERSMMQQRERKEKASTTVQRVWRGDVERKAKVEDAIIMKGKEAGDSATVIAKSLPERNDIWVGNRYESPNFSFLTRKRKLAKNLALLKQLEKRKKERPAREKAAAERNKKRQKEREESERKWKSRSLSEIPIWNVEERRQKVAEMKLEDSKKEKAQMAAAEKRRMKEKNETDQIRAKRIQRQQEGRNGYWSLPGQYTPSGRPEWITADYGDFRREYHEATGGLEGVADAWKNDPRHPANMKKRKEEKEKQQLRIAAESEKSEREKHDRVEEEKARKEYGTIKEPDGGACRTPCKWVRDGWFGGGRYECNPGKFVARTLECIPPVAQEDEISQYLDRDPNAYGSWAGGEKKRRRRKGKTRIKGKTRRKRRGNRLGKKKKFVETLKTWKEKNALYIHKLKARGLRSGRRITQKKRKSSPKRRTTKTKRKKKFCKHIKRKKTKKKKQKSFKKGLKLPTSNKKHRTKRR